jgi:hypothetical protein
MPVGGFTDSSSMLANLPADIFAGISDIPSGDAPAEDLSIEDAPAAPPVEGAPDEDALPVEPQPEGREGDEPPAGDTPAEPVAAAPGEDLPEGIRESKDARGRKEYHLDESRYKTVYGNHKLVQQAQQMLGEPLTPEALDVRNRSFLAQERLFSNLASGDPELQGSVVDFMLGEMNAAREAGEVGVDPTPAFAETVYSKLRDTAPDGYAQLRYLAARDFIGEMFQNAAAKNDQGLFASAQQMARELVGIGPKPENMTGPQYIEHIRETAKNAGIPFFTPQEMSEIARQPDPVSALQNRVRELESQVSGRNQQSEAERFQTWDRSHTQSVHQAISTDAIVSSLASVADSWKAFPQDYQKHVMEPLKSEVYKAMQNDATFNSRVNDLRSRLQRTPSEQVRTQIGNDIKNLFVNRARLAVDEVKTPILKTAAEWLAFRSQNSAGRRSAGQNRTAPKGAATPVNRSLVPDIPEFKGNKYDSKTALAQANRLMASLSR